MMIKIYSRYLQMKIGKLFRVEQLRELKRSNITMAEEQNTNLNMQTSHDQSRKATQHQNEIRVRTLYSRNAFTSKKAHRYLHWQVIDHGTIQLFWDLLQKKYPAIIFERIYPIKRPKNFQIPASISSINASIYSTVSSLKISRKMLTKTRT